MDNDKPCGAPRGLIFSLTLLMAGLILILTNATNLTILGSLMATFGTLMIYSSVTYNQYTVYYNAKNKEQKQPTTIFGFNFNTWFNYKLDPACFKFKEPAQGAEDAIYADNKRVERQMLRAMGFIFIVLIAIMFFYAYKDIMSLLTEYNWYVFWTILFILGAASFEAINNLLYNEQILGMKPGIFNKPFLVSMNVVTFISIFAIVILIVNNIVKPIMGNIAL